MMIIEKGKMFQKQKNVRFALGGLVCIGGYVHGVKIAILSFDKKC